MKENCGGIKRATAKTSDGEVIDKPKNLCFQVFLRFHFKQISRSSKYQDESKSLYFVGVIRGGDLFSHS